MGLPGAVRYPQALTPPGAGGIYFDLAKGESQVDSDDESDVCEEVRDADETTDSPDMLTPLEEDLEVGGRFGSAVVENLGTIARGRLAVRLPEQNLKDKLSKYPLPLRKTARNYPPPLTPFLNAELGGTFLHAKTQQLHCHSQVG